MKSRLIILSAVVLMFSASQGFAEDGHDHGKMADEKGSMMEGHKGPMMEKGSATKVGNTFCPISKQKVGGSMGPAVEYEYEGKIYNFCCAMCLKDFKKDPEKYIKIIEETMASEKAEGGHGEHGQH